MKVSHVFIPNKTATFVPEFAVEDLSLGRTASLMPEFAVKDLHLVRILDDKHTYNLFVPISIVQFNFA